MMPTLEQIFRRIEAGKTAISIKEACDKVGVHTSVYAHARNKYRKGLQFTGLTTGEQEVLIEILRQIRIREDELAEKISSLVCFK